MQNLLFHVDSRCIHGQIVAGWGFREQVKRFLLANDAVAADEWERKQYLETPGSDFETHVLSIAESARRLKEWNDGKKTMLIVGSPHDALRILDSGVVPDLISIGNLEPGLDKRQLAPSVFVGAGERQDLLEIIKRGIKVVILPLPTSKPVPIAELLRENGTTDADR